MAESRHPLELALAGKAVIAACLWCLLVSSPVIAQVMSKPDGAERGPDLVKNGSFDELDANGRPKGWGTAGHAGMEQAITLDTGPAGTAKRALKLVCTKFVPSFPDSHAMVLQMGSVELK